MVHLPLSIVRFNVKDHGQDFIETYRDEQYREFFRRMPVGYKEEEILQLEEITGSQLYVVLDSNKVLIGYGIVNNFCNYGLHCQVGLITKKQYQNLKIENYSVSYYATSKLLNELFKNSPLRKVKMKFLRHRADIEHVLTKYGFTNRTEFFNDCIYDGEFMDELEYSMYREYFLAHYKD